MVSFPLVTGSTEADSIFRPDHMEKQPPFVSPPPLSEPFHTQPIANSPHPLDSSVQDVSLPSVAAATVPSSDPWAMLVFLVFSMPILTWLLILLAPFWDWVFPEGSSSEGQTSSALPDPSEGSVSSSWAGPPHPAHLVASPN